MVSAAKAFKAEPPLEPLTGMDAIVRDFQWRYKDRAKTDQVIDYCRHAKDWNEAVHRAVESRDVMGKHHNHQSKVDLVARRRFGSRIIRNHMLIKRRMTDLEGDPFDILHDWLDNHKPYGIGPVTVYDVAVRIAAFLGPWAEPRQVYVHAGVKQGLKELDFVYRHWAFHGGEVNCADLFGLINAWREKRVDLRRFPSPLDEQTADDVEDILCTYREVFMQWRQDD